jgi:hypothetical protein
VRSRRSVRRTSRAGHPATVPFGSIRICSSIDPHCLLHHRLPHAETNFGGTGISGNWPNAPRSHRGTSMWDVPYNGLRERPYHQGLSQAKRSMKRFSLASPLTSGDIR